MQPQHLITIFLLGLVACGNEPSSKAKDESGSRAPSSKATDSKATGVSSARADGDAWRKNHAGKVLFSSSPFDLANPNVQSKTGFVAGERIYALIVLPKAPAEIRKQNKEPGEGWENNTITGFIKIVVGKKQVARLLWTVKDAEFESGVVEVDLLPDPKVLRQRGPAIFGAAWRKLDAKLHQVTVSFPLSSFNRIPDLASGALELDCSKGLDEHVEIAKTNIEARLDNFLGDAGMKDKAIEAEISETIATDQYTGGPRGTPVKLVISSFDWEIQRNRLSGVITSRQLGARAVVKKEDGNYAVLYLDLDQQYDGTKYGRFRIIGKDFTDL